MLQQRLKRMGQNLIRAVADENLLGRNIVVRRDRLAQHGRARIGIEANTLARGGNRRQYARRRRVWILVGIELDDATMLPLFAGHVGRQAFDDRTPEAPNVLRTKLGPGGAGWLRRAD